VHFKVQQRLTVADPEALCKQSVDYPTSTALDVSIPRRH